MELITVTVLALAAFSASPEKTIAVASVAGPAKSAPAELQRGLEEELEKRGYSVIGEAALKRAERRQSKKLGRVQAAKSAGAEMLASVEIQKEGQKFVATAELVDAASGDMLVSLRRPYTGGPRAAAVGRALGALLAHAADAREKSENTVAEDASTDEDRPAHPVRPDREDRPLASRVVAKDEAADGANASGKASTTLEPRKWAGAEDSTFRLTVGGGGRLATNYAVMVGDEVSGLGYSLSPQMMAQGEARVAFDSGLAFELALSYVPLKFQLATMPAATPDQPIGNQVGVRLRGAYALELSPSVAIAPLAGLAYDALNVQQQQPFNMVVSNKSLAPEAGLRLTVRATSDVVIEGEARARFIAWYDETPTVTGLDGRGFGLTGVLGMRWWVSDNLGAFARVEYDYAAVAMNGTGTRTPFAGDPALENAKLMQSALATGVGLMLAL